MKWFFKSLRQYADFNGRATRTEFWSFILFNLLFAFVWSFLLTAAFLHLSDHSNHSFLRIIYTVYPSYFIMLMLPTLAVTVRRLHDTGKSGWTMLVCLIPVFGLIWLFALMLTEGHNYPNKYGENPQISEVTYNTHIKRKSAGITLMAAASLVLTFSIVFEWLIPVLTGDTLSFSTTFFLLLNILSFASVIILLITGFLIWKEDRFNFSDEKKKEAMLLLLFAIFISFLLNIFHLIDNFVVDSVFHILFYLSIALFALSILNPSQNKKYVHYTALGVIFFASLSLTVRIINGLKMNNHEEIELLTQLQLIFETFYILLPIAFIFLVNTFIPEKEENNFAAESTFSFIPPVKDKSIFVREDRSSNRIWRIFKAPNKDEAIAFLSKQQINHPFFYVVVETPEGNFWKDYKGLFQE